MCHSILKDAIRCRAADGCKHAFSQISASDVEIVPVRKNRVTEIAVGQAIVAKSSGVAIELEVAI